MSFIQISSSRLGSTPQCTHCHAGITISFNWHHAETTRQGKDKRDLSVFLLTKKLRHGLLYHCKFCQQPWYLFGEPAFMNFVPKERIELIERWNENRIEISREHEVLLRNIGQTPPDTYGNGSQYHETPCTVTTTAGERIDLAIVSKQRHAPFEEWRTCRLADEIAKIHPSPYALPLSVRIACSQADEMRMGFAPTLIDLPNGESMILNWTENFFLSSACHASEITLSKRYFDWKSLPPVYEGTRNVIYFIAD